MDENELIDKLKTFKSMLIDAQLRKAGLLAQIEGLNADLLANGLVLERVESMTQQVLKMTAKMAELELEKQKLSEWSIANLPPEFHLTFDN